MELLLGTSIVAAFEIAMCIWVIRGERKLERPIKQSTKQSKILDAKLDAYFEENLKPANLKVIP